MDRSRTATPLDPERWVDEHGDFLYRFAWVRLRDADTALELVQEALLAGLSARRNFRGQCSERSWLAAILKRKIVDHHRKHLRERAHRVSSSDAWIDGQFTRRGTWKSKPDEWSDDDPSQALTRADFRTTLAGCLDRLPPRLRKIFVMRHVDERGPSEVCEEAEISDTNLWVMLHRARMRLWKCLSKNWFCEDEETSMEERP